MIRITIIIVIGFFLGNFSCNGIAIGSSTADLVASGPTIENAEGSLSQDRAERSFALLVPLNGKLNEEHHKSKRCWKARPVQKVKLSMNPRTAQKHYGDESEEKSKSDESFEDNLSRKYPNLKLVRLNNGKKNVKELFRTNSDTQDDSLSHESEGNSEDVILKKIKHHLNSDDYNVLALVGKRVTSNSAFNKQAKKYVCYCKANNCLGGNCSHRTMYRPCLTCKNSRPRNFINGNVNSNYGSSDDDARIPLHVQYPTTINEIKKYSTNDNVRLMKNPGLSHVTNDDNKGDYESFQQNEPTLENRRYQYSYNTPRIVLSNPNNDVHSLNHCRILQIPISTKSTVENGISNSKIPTNFYSQGSGNPTANEYRHGNLYYPLIGKAADIGIPNKNHQADTQNFNTLYHSNNGFIGSANPFENQGIGGFRQPVEMGTKFPSISNNMFHDNHQNGNGFGWNTLNGMRAQGYHHDDQGPVVTSDYQEKPVKSSVISTSLKKEFYDEKYHKLEANDENVSDFEARNYDASTEDNFDASSTASHRESHEDYENISVENNWKHGIHEDKTKEGNGFVQITNHGGSMNANLASHQTEDQRNANYDRDQPEKYKLPLIISTDEMNTPQELYSERNSMKIASTTGAIIDDHELPGTESSNYDDHADYLTDETTLRDQLGQPANEQSNLDQYSYDTTTQMIIKLESDEEKTTELHDNGKLVAVEPEYVGAEESEKLLSNENYNTPFAESTSEHYSDTEVITGRYISPKDHNDLGETSYGDIRVTETGGDYEHSQHDVDANHENPNDMLQSENVLDEPLIKDENQLLEDDMTEIITAVDENSSDNVYSDEHKIVEKIQPIEFHKNEAEFEIADSTASSIFEADDSQNLESHSEKEYSLLGSVEPKQSNLCRNHMKSDEIIEPPTRTGTPLIDVIVKQQIDSGGYESDTSDAEDNHELYSTTGKDTAIPNEEIVTKIDPSTLPGNDQNISGRLSAKYVDTDGNNLEKNSRTESTESYEDVSYSEDYRFMDYSMEENPEVSTDKNSESPANNELLRTEYNDNVEKHENDKPPDFSINDSPTRYFSPNDRLLEYIRKHSQNLVRDFEVSTKSAPHYSTTSGYVGRNVVPVIYHSKINQNESAEPECEEHDSGSESDEILEKKTNNKEGHDWYDYEDEKLNGQAKMLDDNVSHEFSASHEEETSGEGSLYEKQNNQQLSDYSRYKTRPELIVGGKNFDGESEEFPKPVNHVPFVAPSEILTTNLNHENHDDDVTYFPQTDMNRGNKMYERIDDFHNVERHHSKEEFRLTSEHEDKSVSDFIGENSNEKNVNKFHLISSETERSTEITESYEDDTGESTSVENVGKIQNPRDFYHATTEVPARYETIDDSTEANGNLYTNEENFSVAESPEESTATQIPIDSSETRYYNSEKSTEDSISMENSQGLNEESEITHLRHGSSSHNTDSTVYSMSTEDSMDSSTIDSTEDLSTSKYRQYYNGRDNVGSVARKIPSCSHRIADGKSITESYNNDKRVSLDESLSSVSQGNLKTNVRNGVTFPPGFPNNHNTLDYNVNTFEIKKNAYNQNYGQTNTNENPLLEMNSGINSFGKTTLNRYVEVGNQNSNLDDEVSQNEHVSHQAIEYNVENDDSSGYNAETEKYNPIESLESSAETITKDVKEELKYRTKQGKQNLDDFRSAISRGDAQDESLSLIQEKKTLTQSYESEKNSEKKENVEIVGETKSTGPCTKPTEVRNDVGYLGRISAKKSNHHDVKSLGDLIDSDLYYIGDGVRLPLTIKKLKDGSLALSISDKICEQRIKEKCPCCVPRQGRILQEKRDENIAEKSSEESKPSILSQKFIQEDEKSETDEAEFDDSEILDNEEHQEINKPVSNIEKEKQHHNKRTTRSTTMPVDEFVGKYNLILNLNEQLRENNGEIPLTHNMIQNDYAMEQNSDLTEKIALMKDQVPVNEKTDVLLSVLNEFVATESKEVILGVVNGIEKKLEDIKLRGKESSKDDQEEDKFGVQEVRYGYQRDNPILHRIKIIQELLKENHRCEHKYQKYCDDAIAQKTELLTMILYWLKDLVISKQG